MACLPLLPPFDKSKRGDGVMVMVMVCGEWMGVWWWLLLSGLGENGCKHIGNNTDVDEVMTTDTHALSFEIVCSGQLQSFLELAVILKKQINK